MSIGRKSRDLRLTLWYFNRGWTTKTMGSQSAHLDTKKTGSAFPTSLSLSTMEQSSLPASSSSLMIEGSLGSMPELRERRRPGSLSYMCLPIIPLTNWWSPSPPGSVIASGATRQLTPSSKMQSMTLMTGDSLPTSIAITNMTKNALISPRKWSFWKLTSKAPINPAPSAKSNSLLPISQIKSNTLHSVCLWGSFSWHERGEAQSNCLESPPTKDKDVSI